MSLISSQVGLPSLGIAGVALSMLKVNLADDCTSCNSYQCLVHFLHRRYFDRQVVVCFERLNADDSTFVEC